MERKCQRHLWLLTGTGEGPELVCSLIERGWNVSVSVVSKKASIPYLQFPLENLFVGKLSGEESIRNLIEETRLHKGGFEWVIDLTHPFALKITSCLKKVCMQIGQPYIRFERPIENISGASLVSGLKEFSRFRMRDHSILMALGSRQLGEAVRAAQLTGAKTFARVLPTQDSLVKALSSNLEEKNLAILTPSKGGDINLELALCRKWAITDVLCRQSGGVTERMWKDVSHKLGIHLWMIKRPSLEEDMATINTFEEIYKLIGSI